MIDDTTSTPLPLVTREALAAFTQRLVEAFAPQMVILFGSQARGEARWDSDADLLVVMPYEGQPRDTVRALLSAGAADFPLDLHLRRLQEIAPRYRWGDPYIREAIDHGELLHGELNRSTLERSSAITPVRNPVVQDWIEQAERHWRMAALLTDLPPGYLSNRLAGTIPDWQPDPATLNTLTQAALAYLDPGDGDPEPAQDTAWALAEAGPLRESLRRWFDSLEVVEGQDVA